MLDHEFEERSLKALAPNEAEKMLGVYLTADGNNRTQVEKLRDKTDTWNAQVNAGYLNQHEAWTALNSTIMKTIEYLLPAITLTPKDSTKIMAPVLEAGLKSSGICRYMARELVYGSRKFQGLGIKNPQIKQGIDKIMFWLQQTYRKNLGDRLVQQTYEEMQLETGSQIPFFLLPFKRYKKAVTNSWIKDVW